MVLHFAVYCITAEVGQVRVASSSRRKEPGWIEDTYSGGTLHNQARFRRKRFHTSLVIKSLLGKLNHPCI